VSGDRHDELRWQRRFDDAALTRRILDRTTGRACGRAEELLGARWDGALDGTDRELLAGHLDDCAACRELAAVLDRLQPALPGLAEREPGPAFTARVLARTSAVQPVPSGSAPGLLDRLGERLQQTARRLWNRPRFALEAAWTAAALTALLVWSPLAPSAASQQAVQVVQAGATAGPGLVERVERLADSAVLAGREIIGPRAEELEKEMGEITSDLADRIESVKRAGLSLWQSLTGDDTQPENE
jgi:anti-sigma factor RsiW